MNSIIQQEIKQGRDITHTLTLKAPTELLEECIYNKINNVPITFGISGYLVTITWKSIDKCNYFCDSSFTTAYTLAHTEMLMNKLNLDLELYPNSIKFFLNTPIFKRKLDIDYISDLTY
jgi:hypothetical protein